MPNDFLTGPDWQGSSGPYVNRMVWYEDFWPHSVNGPAGKHAIADGDHMFLAVGPTAQKPINPVGVSVSYNSATHTAVLNFAPGFIAKAYVCNITTYAQGSASAWSATLDFGQIVYVDPSDDLPTGVTLSLASADDKAANNPRAGVVWTAQTEDPNTGIGGSNTWPFPKSFEDGTSTHELLVYVMLWPDSF